MRTLLNIIILFLTSAGIQGQEAEINRLIAGELKMSFPSIYFKHNSTDYAIMPYTVDSCFKHIALQYDNNINSLVIWRDSVEKEALTLQRIRRLKIGLSKYLHKKKIEIYSMNKEQKISGRTIKMASDKSQIDYLLTLNSVLNFSKMRVNKKIKYSNHIMRPSITCWSCWKSGFHWLARMKVRKMERHNKDSNKVKSARTS